MDTADLTLTVAVLTYRRPDDLAAVLPALTGQVAGVRSAVARGRVLVVDNSPEGDARQTVESFAAADGSVPVVYEHEPTPGIPAGRNRALDASAESDLLVFIDDDERPSERWLALLLQTLARHDAVAAVGAVVSEYEIPPSEWIEAGRFFQRRRLPTGTPVTVAATNNLLLDLRAVRAHGLRFDEQMGLNGGDDTLFTLQLSRHGRLVWCDEAVVVDKVPRARISRDWVIRRALRTGNSSALIAVRMAESTPRRIGARARSLGAGLVRVGGGGGRLVAGWVTRELGLQARGLRTAARGAGMILGACDLSYLEYHRPDAVRPRRIEIARR